MKVLVFDTETTGLIPRRYESISECPYILQLACILYDTKTNHVIDVINEYVSISDNIEIPERVTEINKITRELLVEKGKDINGILDKFYNLLGRCDMILGHNVDFDVKMIKLEFQRNSKVMEDNMIQKLYKYYCTMKSGTALCQIQCENKYGKYFKYPRLEELYYHLFKKLPENLHDAYTDIVVCLQCYMNMEHEKMIEENVFTSFDQLQTV